MPNHAQTHAPAPSSLSPKHPTQPTSTSSAYTQNAVIARTQQQETGRPDTDKRPRVTHRKMPKVTTPREQETRRPTDRSPTHQRGPTHQAPSEGRSHPGTAGPQPHTGRAALLTHEACDYRNANRYARLGPNEQQAQEGNERQGRRPRAHTATGAPPTQRAAVPTPAPSRSRPPARSHSPAHPSSPRHELTSNSKLTSTKRVHETGRQESTAPRQQGHSFPTSKVQRVMRGAGTVASWRAPHITCPAPARIQLTGRPQSPDYASNSAKEASYTSLTTRPPSIIRSLAPSARTPSN